MTRPALSPPSSAPPPPSALVAPADLPLDFIINSNSTPTWIKRAASDGDGTGIVLDGPALALALVRHLFLSSFLPSILPSISLFLSRSLGEVKRAASDGDGKGVVLDGPALTLALTYLLTFFYFSSCCPFCSLFSLFSLFFCSLSLSVWWKLLSLSFWSLLSPFSRASSLSLFFSL